MRRKTSPNSPKRSYAPGKQSWIRRSRPPEPLQRAPRNPPQVRPVFLSWSPLNLNLNEWAWVSSHQSSSTTQGFDRDCISLDCGRFEQWRPYGKERRREHVDHRRQNARQVHRNSLRCPRARIGLPCAVSFCSLSTAFLTFHRFPSVRPHIATCAHGGGYRVQGLQGDNTGIQVEDTDVVRQPQRQEQPWPAPKRDGRRYPHSDVCKNDQSGLSSSSPTNSGKKMFC